jgi:hypothetical protein
MPSESDDRTATFDTPSYVIIVNNDYIEDESIINDYTMYVDDNHSALAVNNNLIR